ncbi:hypothetical protein [Streptomyces hainanensis]|uniref:Uncharacterized protein n=1 Tax=Streptomyces hainanensis TaxID=402648 RepID=A0A4V2Y0R5_9ACTN|nr:hypothetical protein [Streptomyces hainanensis]TDC65855.1 hypothetical protein E1283_30275 [Streptomyces hainanensis]
MARLRHTLALASVDRGRVESFIAVVHEVLESLHAEDGTLVAEDGRAVRGARLLAGEHLEPGARYRGTAGADGILPSEGGTPRWSDGELTVLGWDRAKETALRFDLGREEQELSSGAKSSAARVVTEVRLASSDRPQRAGLSVAGALTRADGRPRRWRSFTVKGRLDLGRWWEAAGGAPGRPPLSLGIRYALLRADLQAVPRPTADGTWRLEVLTVLRGRGLARPVVAVPLLATRRLLQRSLAQALDRLAEDWRTRVASELARDPEAFRQWLLDEACRDTSV